MKKLHLLLRLLALATLAVTDGHTRLRFTPIEWTEDALTLAPDVLPLPNGSGK